MSRRTTIAIALAGVGYTCAAVIGWAILRAASLADDAQENAISDTCGDCLDLVEHDDDGATLCVTCGVTTVAIEADTAECERAFRRAIESLRGEAL